MPSTGRESQAREDENQEASPECCKHCVGHPLHDLRCAERDNLYCTVSQCLQNGCRLQSACLRGGGKGYLPLGEGGTSSMAHRAPTSDTAGNNIATTPMRGKRYSAP